MFEILPLKNKLSKKDWVENGKIPIYSSDSNNSGITGYTNIKPVYIVNDKNPIYLVFGDHTRTLNIAKNSFCIQDNVKVLKPTKNNNIGCLLYIVSVWKKQIPNLGYSRHWKIAKNAILKLPIKNSKIDFDFMESFIAELEAERVAELEAYLVATGLKDYTLTRQEQKALNDFKNIQWQTFNLKNLFGKSTRGKRLKSADRISGDLPFATAGETDEGISAFIGNDINEFSANTTTIDMFGSAKYRNYEYGADDHIAVVHTERLPKFAAIFTTVAIHRASHNGQFNYSRNFYAKDADELDISLPVKEGQPDYKLMETLISAIQKIVIKDVVLYADKKIEATNKVIQNAQ